MAKIIRGNEAVFETLRAPAPSALDYAFMEQQNQAFMSVIDNVGEAVRSKIQDYRQAYYDSDAARVAQAIMGKTEALFHADVWQDLPTRSRLQNAPNVMLRALMANPVVRDLANDQACEAYGDRYYDVLPSADPYKHRDYQMVTNGIVHYGEDTEDELCEFDFTVDTYSDNFVEDDPLENLGTINRQQILDCWELQNELISDDIDPTDSMNGSLG